MRLKYFNIDTCMDRSEKRVSVVAELRSEKHYFFLYYTN